MFSVTASAQTSTVELSKKDVVLNVDVSTAKMKLSNAGYSSLTLKVLVPELADVTVLDHRNVGEGAPCLATYDANTPEEIIQGRPTIDQVQFTIVLQKTTQLDPVAQTCKVSLNELIDGKIRGFLFSHERTIVVGNRNVADCR